MSGGDAMVMFPPGGHRFGTILASQPPARTRRAEDDTSATSIALLVSRMSVSSYSIWRVRSLRTHCELDNESPPSLEKTSSSASDRLAEDGNPTALYATVASRKKKARVEGVACPEEAPIVVMMVVTEAPKAGGAPGAWDPDKEGYSPPKVKGRGRLTIRSMHGWERLVSETWTELHVLSKGTRRMPMSSTS